MAVSSKEDAKIAAKVINSYPVVKKAILISIGKEDARFPHPLDVLNSLFVIAKTEGVVGIDKDITALALKEVMDNAVPDLSTKYEGDVSFQIFYNNINRVIEETRCEVNESFEGETDPEALAERDSKLNSLAAYDLLFDVMGFKQPCLVMVFPCFNDELIPPSDFSAFLCETDVCSELQLILDAESVHTVH